MYPKLYKYSGPQIDEIVEVYQKGKKHRQYINTNMDICMDEKKKLFHKSVLICAVRL